VDKISRWEWLSSVGCCESEVLKGLRSKEPTQEQGFANTVVSGAKECAGGEAVEPANAGQWRRIRNKQA
jgi:hypothetical protein